MHEPFCVSIYLPTTPVTQDADGDRIALKSATSDVVARLEAENASADAIAEIAEQLGDLVEDDLFWAYQALSLAIFARPTGIRTYRLPNRLEAMSAVGERFVVKPLLRTATFPQTALVLALAQGSVRLVEISPDLPPHEMRIPGLPSDVASAVGKASIKDRSPGGALQGSEGQKVRMRQYARQIDHALRPVLTGSDLPLILAATQPLEAIFRSVNSYPGLVESTIRGNPEEISDADLASEARLVLDALYAAEIEATLARVDEFASRGRGATEIGDVARAATFGAVDIVLVDIEADLPGEIDETTGAVELGASGSGGQVTDEIARRVMLTGGRVMAVRKADIPGGEAAVAVLRYPV